MFRFLLRNLQTTTLHHTVQGAIKIKNKIQTFVLVICRSGHTSSHSEQEVKRYRTDDNLTGESR